MVRARFTGSNHYHDGEPLEEGEVVELTEEQFEQWDYQFVRLDSANGENATSDTENGISPDDEGDKSPSQRKSESEAASGSESSPDNVVDLTVAELESALSDGEYDDRLDELEIEERSKDNPRKTALEAIEDRKEQV